MQAAPIELRTCRRCGAPLAPERVSWGKDGLGAWSCTRCGAVRFEVGAERPRSTDIVRDDAGDAGGYRSAARGGEVVLLRRWRRPVHVAMVLLPLVVLGLPVIAAVLGHPEVLALMVQLWYAVFVFGLVGYVGLCGLVNSTRLELHDGVLRVTHGPLPWKKDKALPANALADVWTQHVVVADAPDIYRLRVALRDGGEIVLVDELPSAEDGVFLEEKIAARLGFGERG